MMEIGDKVKVLKTVDFLYDNNNQRITEETELQDTEPYIVVGIVKRCLGKFVPGSKGSSFCNYEDYEQAQLKVTSKIDVIQLRKTIRSKIIEALPESISYDLSN